MNKISKILVGVVILAVVIVIALGSFKNGSKKTYKIGGHGPSYRHERFIR